MDLPDAIATIRPSVVQFTAAMPDDHRPRVMGSGFIVDDGGHVATAAHVVSALHSLNQAGARTGIGLAYPDIDNEDIGGVKGLTMRQNFFIVGGEVIDVDTRRDVAVLEMQPNPFTDSPPSMIKIGDTEGPRPMYTPASLDTARPSDGEAVAVSGYPLGGAALVTTAGHLASSWETQVRDTWDPVAGWPIPTVDDVYLADVSVNPGNSGGPLYRVPDGSVVGVCVAYRTAPLHFTDPQGGQVMVDGRPVGLNAGLAVVAPIRHVLEILELDAS